MQEMYCYSPEEMAAFVSGGAGREASSYFEAHVADCARCRREWIEVSLAMGLNAQALPAEVQRAVAAPGERVPAPGQVRVRPRTPVFAGSRTGMWAACAAAALLSALLLVLLWPARVKESAPAVPAPVAHLRPRPQPPPPADTELVRETAAPLGKTAVREVEEPAPAEPEEDIRVVEVPGVAMPEKPVDRVVQAPAPLPASEQAAGTPEIGAGRLEPLKDSPPPVRAVPPERLPTKLTREDAEAFKKYHYRALLAVAQEEQELLAQARQQANQPQPIMGRPIQPSAPAAPAPSKPEPPKEEPKSGTPMPPTAPPLLPRVEELRKEGKLPPAQPKPQPLPEPVAGDPKQEPGQQPGPVEDAGPTLPPVPPPAPAGLARQPEPLPTIPEVSAEELRKLGESAGLRPVGIPGLVPGVVLALAEVVKDAAGDEVVHLLYYFGTGGFSVFERKTARTDKEDSYHVLYNGKGKTRTLMWAAAGREFILVAEKLSKRELCAIEASVRDLLE